MKKKTDKKKPQPAADNVAMLKAKAAKEPVAKFLDIN